MRLKNRSELNSCRRIQNLVYMCKLSRKLLKSKFCKKIFYNKNMILGYIRIKKTKFVSLRSIKLLINVVLAWSC